MNLKYVYHTFIAQSKCFIFLLLCATSLSTFAQNVGIGTAAPNTKLDIAGDIAWRTWNLSLVNGANATIAPASNYSYYRITGPTAAFDIDGLGNPFDGRLVTLYNATTQTMTINNLVGGAGTNGIRAGSANLSIGAWGSVTLQYNTTDNIWVVVNAIGATSTGNDWALLGNAGTVGGTNFIGTTDNQYLSFRTNNIEKVRITNAGNANSGVVTMGMQQSNGTQNAIDPFSTLEVYGNNINNGDIVGHGIGNNGFGTYFIATKARGTAATPAIVQSGDGVFIQESWAYDGAAYRAAAAINTFIEGVPGAGDMPMAITLNTSPDGSAAYLERVRVTNGGFVGIGTSTPAALLHVFANGANWNTAVSNGDVYVGNPTYGLRIGVATGGGGAGDVRMTASGGTNRLMLGGGANTFVATVDGTNQRVGINTFDPLASLDVNGSVAFREGAWLTLVNGANDDIALPATSYHTIVGPTAAFSISGFTGGVNGRIITLVNSTSYPMTIVSYASSALTNRLLTANLANIVVPTYGSASFQYNASYALWELTAYNGTDGDDWKLDGNSNGVVRSIGTNDNFYLPIETNGTEKMRVSTAGAVGIGVAAVGTNYANGFSRLELLGDGNYGDFLMHTSGNNAWINSITNFRSRGTHTLPTIVQNGDEIAMYTAYAYDGTKYGNPAIFQHAGYISMNIDGTPGTDDLPTRITFGTTNDGSLSATEKMRITNSGNVGINITAPTSKLHVYQNQDITKYVTLSNAIQTTTGADYDNVALYGLGRGASGTWGYGVGAAAIGDAANSWGAVGLYAGLGTAIPNFSFVSSGSYALYADASNLGYAGIFMNGNVGIGTTNPTTNLHVYSGNSTVAYMQSIGTQSDVLYYNSGGLGSWQVGTNNAGNGTSSNQFYIYDANTAQYAFTVQRGTGRVGIGNDPGWAMYANTPVAKLEVADPSTGNIMMFRARNDAATGTQLGLGSVEYFHDQSSTTDVAGGSYFAINLGGSAAFTLQVGGAGTAGKPGGGSWAVSSDARLKEDVNPFKEGLSTIRNINPVYYKYNGKANLPKNYYVGVIAQELQTVAPYMVGTYEFLQGDTPLEEAADKIETYNQVDNSALSYITVNALKELDSKTQKMQAAFTNISDFGMETLTAAETFVPFSSDFQQLIANNTQAVVTLTPINSTLSLAIVSQNANGFTVKINGFNNTAVNANWIAMAKIKNDAFETPINYTASEREAMLNKVKIVPGKINLQKEVDEKAKREASKSAMKGLPIPASLENPMQKQQEAEKAQKAIEMQQSKSEKVEKSEVAPINPNTTKVRTGENRPEASNSNTQSGKATNVAKPSLGLQDKIGKMNEVEALRQAEIKAAYEKNEAENKAKLNESPIMPTIKGRKIE